MTKQKNAVYSVLLFPFINNHKTVHWIIAVVSNKNVRPQNICTQIVTLFPQPANILYADNTNIEKLTSAHEDC